jgi:hypothetical protein
MATRKCLSHKRLIYLESERRKHLPPLRKSSHYAALPQYTETLRQEIVQLERQEACSELDICDLPRDALVSLPLSQQLRHSRFVRAELNAKTNSLSREISEAEDQEQNLRNEVRGGSTSPHAAWSNPFHHSRFQKPVPRIACCALTPPPPIGE